MDIKAKISEITEKITSDKSLLENFKSDPVATVESLIGVDLPDDAVNKVVDAVKAKITADSFSGVAGKLKNLFGK